MSDDNKQTPNGSDQSDERQGDTQSEPTAPPKPTAPPPSPHVGSATSGWRSAPNPNHIVSLVALTLMMIFFFGAVFMSTNSMISASEAKSDLSAADEAQKRASNLVTGTCTDSLIRDWDEDGACATFYDEDGELEYSLVVKSEDDQVILYMPFDHSLNLKETPDITDRVAAMDPSLEGKTIKGSPMLYSVNSLMALEYNIKD